MFNVFLLHLCVACPMCKSLSLFFFFSCLPKWNSHGYDIAKVFGPKMTSVSPVWLQLKRKGPESFHITGLHDNDQGRCISITRVLLLYHAE